MGDERCTEPPPQDGSHVDSSMESPKEGVEDSTPVTAETSSVDQRHTLKPRSTGTDTEDKTMVEKEIGGLSHQQGQSTTMDMDHLTRRIDQLSVSHEGSSDAPPQSVEVDEPSVKQETQQPCEPSKPKPTAQSVIETIKKLKMSRAPGMGMGKEHPGSLIAHGPDHGKPCSFYEEQQRYQVGYDQTNRKRGAPEGDRNASKFFREKGPSEQDERDYLPDLEGDVVNLYEYLLKQTQDPDMVNTVLYDIGTLDPADKAAVGLYVDEEIKRENIMAVPSESYMYAPRVSTSQQVPRSPQSVTCLENAPSPSSGYGSTVEEVFSPDPSLPPGSPDFSDTTATEYYSDNSNPARTITPFGGNMLDMEAFQGFNNNFPTQLTQEYYTGGEQQQVVVMTPPLPPPVVDDIIHKQLINMGQTHITERALQFVPHQQQQQQPQLQLLKQPSTNGVLQRTTYTHVLTTPTTSSTQVPSLNGNISPTKNCGCGLQNCIHIPIAPKPTSGTSPMPVVHPVTVNRPPATKCSDIIERLPRNEMVGARRWVASIKTTELPNTDCDGDLSLHIVVCQADRPRLIALLERCKRENMVEELINRQNVQTQTLLFMAVLATPESSAADMVAILVENNANPLVRTVLTRKNSMDMEYRYPIHVLALKGNIAVPIMSELLTKKREEQLNIGCDSGHTALHYAALAHRVRPSDEMVRHLLMQGADINAKEGKRGRSALHYMVETQDVRLVLDVLQRLGRDKAKQAVKVATYDGCTALHIAAGLRMEIESHKIMLRILIDHGAEVGAKNAQGQRASDLIPHDRRELLGVLKCGSLKGMSCPPYQRQQQH